MIVNNPNECYTMFMIAILLSASRLLKNVHCYANLSNCNKIWMGEKHVKFMCIAFFLSF